MKIFQHLGWLEISTLLAVAPLALCGSSACAADQKIPLEIRLIGSDTASDISVSTPTSTFSLTPDTERKRWEGELSKDAQKVRVVDVSLIFGTASYPLRLRILPTTERVQFNVLFDKPESCSDPYVKSIETRASTKNDAMKRALTAGFLLARVGNIDNCDTHSKRVKKARYERYVNLMQLSFEFLVPPQIESEFIDSTQDRVKTKQLVDIYRVLEAGRDVEALQAGVKEAKLAGHFDVALANSEIIEGRAKKDEESASVIYAKIERNELKDQTDDLRVMAAEGRAAERREGAHSPM